MKELENRILKDGIILGNDIVKVDSFINHQIDTKFTMEMAKNIVEHYSGKKFDKVLTIEVSGIAIALCIGLILNIPVVFAKKTKSKTLSEEVYTSSVFSFTKNITYDISVEKKFINKGDNLLLVDDFLANGRALAGLIEITEIANANIEGIAILIEKSFQEGRKIINSMGYEVYSLARIHSIKNNKIKFI